MAERVLENLEDFLSMGEVLINGGIFDNNELKKIMEKRTKHEYKLCKRHPQKEDFLSYIKYDTSLLLLMNKRIKKLRFSHGEAILSRQFERLHYMYNNYHKKYRTDLEIYDQHIYLCHKMNEMNFVSQVISEMLRRNIKNIESWRIASKWYTINKNLEMSEKLYEKATVILKNDVQLWIAIMEFRLFKILHSKIVNNDRSIELISVTIDGALKSCQYNCQLLMFIIEFTKNQLYQYNLLINIFNRIANENQMTLKLFQIILSGIIKCPLELGTTIYNRVDSLKQLFEQYHRKSYHHNKQLLVTNDILQLFTDTFQLYCQNYICDLDINLINHFLDHLKSLNELFSDENEIRQFPYCDTIAIYIVDIYMMLLNNPPSESVLTQELLNHFINFTTLFTKCSLLWMKYLNFISETMAKFPNYITLWCDIFVKADTELIDTDAINAATKYINSLTLFDDINYMETNLNSFIDLFYKIHPNAINSIFMNMVSNTSIVNIVVIDLTKFFTQLKSHLNVNDVTEQFIESLTKNVLFPTMLNLDNWKTNTSSTILNQYITFVRRLYEFMVQPKSNHNTCIDEVNRWLSYIKFERFLNDNTCYSETSLSVVTNLYNRALKQLDSSLIQDFITKFTLLNVSS